MKNLNSASVLKALALVCLVTVSCSKVYTVKDTAANISFALTVTSTSSRITFSVPYASATKSFVFHAKTAKGDCPGYAYWFQKDQVALPSLTINSGCVAGEPTIKIRYELGTDFYKRHVDAIENGVYSFDGELNYKDSIDKFSPEAYTSIRIIMRAASGAVFDKTYPVS